MKKRKIPYCPECQKVGISDKITPTGKLKLECKSCALSFHEDRYPVQNYYKPIIVFETEQERKKTIEGGSE